MDDLTEAEQAEYRQAEAANFPQNDEKGRKNPATMTDRELLLELILTFRQLGDTLEEVGQNPMLRAIPGLGGLFGGK